MNKKSTKLFLVAAILCCCIMPGNVFAGASSAGIAISSIAAESTPTDDGGPCPAAALLGSDNPQLDTLRQFRDTVLAKSPAGQKLIKLYYATGNKIEALFESNPAVKSSAKKALEAILPAVDTLVNK
ncbi:MAG: CFI-box-CTERM domain-containing protein [Pseudomonadota bacterium]